MITKKYFREIARMIKDSENFRELSVSMANFFEHDNPRFDRKKFLEACGYD